MTPQFFPIELPMFNYTKFFVRPPHSKLRNNYWILQLILAMLLENGIW